jgi:hypothetical protein
MPSRSVVAVRDPVNAPKREYAAGITNLARQPPLANWSKSRHGEQVVSRLEASASGSAWMAGASSRPANRTTNRDGRDTAVPFQWKIATAGGPSALKFGVHGSYVKRYRTIAAAGPR